MNKVREQERPGICFIMAVLALQASLKAKRCCMSGRLTCSHYWQSTKGMSAAEHQSTAHRDHDISKLRRIFSIELLDKPISHQQVVRPICDLCTREPDQSINTIQALHKESAKAAEAYSTTQENQISKYPVNRKKEQGKYAAQIWEQCEPVTPWQGKFSEDGIVTIDNERYEEYDGNGGHKNRWHRQNKKETHV